METLTWDVETGTIGLRLSEGYYDGEKYHISRELPIYTLNIDKQTILFGGIEYPATEQDCMYFLLRIVEIQRQAILISATLDEKEIAGVRNP